MPKHTKESLIEFIEKEPLRNPKYYFKNYQYIYIAAAREFGSWKNFIETAGLDYEGSKKAKTFYSAEEVIKFFGNENELKNPKYYEDNHDLMYRSAFKRFGSLEKAVEAAGKDYYSSLKHKPWAKEQMEKIIIERMRLERNINITHMENYYSFVPRAVKKYGSFEALIEKCGKKYRRIKKHRDFSNENILFDILSAEARNIDISSAGIRIYDPGLYSKIYIDFEKPKELSFITNYDYALMRCGINPESVRIHKNWDPYLILYDLREPVKEGRNSAWLRETSKEDLLYAAISHFGSFDKAIETTQRLEKLNLFDLFLEFRYIKKYKEEISGLRSISMEGRVRKKRNRNYIMNINKHAKKIKRKKINQNLKAIENYLLKSEELATCREIKKYTGIRNRFLVDATPTRTIGCALGKDLIPEMEKKYSLEGHKFRGPKDKICRKIFYYHNRNEEKLKEKWAKENLR